MTNKISKSIDELNILFELGEISYSSKIDFKFPDGEWKTTTYGRLLIWDISGMLVEQALDKKLVKELINKIQEDHYPKYALKRIKRLQDLAFKAATKGAISLSMDDFKFESKFDKTLEDIQLELDHNKVHGRERLEILDSEMNKRVREWEDNVDTENPLYHMKKSGARVNDVQVRQMVIGKGLLTNMTGEINEHMITSSLSQGLGTFDYFRTCGPARRGLANNHFVVPASGYFTRQLVNCSRDLTVVENDCGSVSSVPLPGRMARGYYTPEGELITKEKSKSLGDTEIQVRSPLTCESSKGGLCAKCIGINPATSEDWYIGAGIGTIAAQHVSEPATQGGLRGKHTSGSVTLAEYESAVDNVLTDIIHSFGGIGTMFIVASTSNSKTINDFMDSTTGPIEAANELSKYIWSLFNEKAHIDVHIGHIQVILRACTDQVDIDGKGKIGLRSYGERGKVVMRTVNQVPNNYPSWLKRLGFGHVKANLIKAVNTAEVSRGTPTERIMFGRVIGED